MAAALTLSAPVFSQRIERKGGQRPKQHADEQARGCASEHGRFDAYLSEVAGRAHEAHEEEPEQEAHEHGAQQGQTEDRSPRTQPRAIGLEPLQEHSEPRAQRGQHQKPNDAAEPGYGQRQLVWLGTHFGHPRSLPQARVRSTQYTARVNAGAEADEFRDRVVDTVRGIQTAVCDALEALEVEHGSGAKFRDDAWTREGGGGGCSRVLTDGAVFEKGGVNVSVVHGEFTSEFAKQVPGSGTSFFATGVSLVLHPRSPHVPTCHANFRHIVHGDKAWFGGGADLTPYYLQPDDEAHFHEAWRRVCERYDDVADYPEFAAACDRYFYLPHRGERRGVGGIFFDHMWVDASEPDRRERVLSFVHAAGHTFDEAYLPIVRRRLATPVTPDQRSWQELRRGRYVEFNLLHDRGTVFGLKTGGRTESILMSLPPRVRWGYCEEPEPETPEHALLQRLRRPPSDP